MALTDVSVGQVYNDAEARFRFTSFLRRLMGGVLGLLLVGGAVMAGVINAELRNDEQQLVLEERDEALALSASLALTPADSLPSLLTAAGLDGSRVNADDTIDHLVTSWDTRSGAFADWRDRVVRTAARADSRTFVTRDPSGQTWWHSQVVAPNDGVLITSRPAAPASSARTTILSVLAVVMALTLAAFAYGWRVLESKVARASRVLLEASEDLRVRGEIRPVVRDGLDSIGSTPLELQRLGQTLRDIEHETQDGFRQVDSLLRAAGALGGSLDESVVLSTSLEHLQLLLGVDRSAIIQYDLRARTVDIRAALGHDDRWLNEMRASIIDETLPSLRSIRDGRPVQVSDTESSAVGEQLRSRSQRHGYRSLLAVPLSRDLELPSALVLQSVVPRSYSFDEIELCKSFGSIASAALRNAELFGRTDERLRRQTLRLEAIVESVGEGLLVEGADGRLLYANAMMRSLFPAAESPVEGMRSDDFLAGILSETPDVDVDEVVAQIRGLGEASLDVELAPRSSGSRRSFRVQTFAVRDSRGADVGRGQTWSDVTRDRELDRMKSGILAAVSHEFRTPLALIKGYATTLLADDVNWNAADQREFLQLVSSEADRLTSLVQRILDMRRIDAGMVSLQLMPVRLPVLIDAVLDGLPHEVDRIRVAEIPPVTIDVDAARVVTALRNLVENACKYSPAEHVVDVGATLVLDPDGDMVELVVRDHGRGVAEENREQIFGTFVRGETGLAAEHSGVGLGLAIARGFVAAHGGHVWVQDPEEGPGAAFHMSLPTHTDREAPERVSVR